AVAVHQASRAVGARRAAAATAVDATFAAVGNTVLALRSDAYVLASVTKSVDAIAIHNARKSARTFFAASHTGGPAAIDRGLALVFDAVVTARGDALMRGDVAKPAGAVGRYCASAAGRARKTGAAAVDIGLVVVFASVVAV